MNWKEQSKKGYKKRFPKKESKGLKVLSLFDGMSCGRLALDKLGIKVDKYYASEIDKYAIQVAQANYPDTIHIGDVTKIDAKDYQDIDLILGGSPCQGFSFANAKGLAFDDPRSALFFEFVRLLKEIKPKYFLLENVRMKKEYLEIITEQVSACYPDHQGNDLFNSKIEPILINSSLLTAQNRLRYYWTNIPNVEQPKDSKIVLRDILEDSDDWGDQPQYLKNHFHDEPRGNQVRHIDEDKAKCLTASMYKGQIQSWIKKDKPIETHDTPKQVGTATDINGHDILKRVYSPDGKAPTLTTSGGGNREPKVIVGGAFRGRAYDQEGKRMDRDGKSVANATKQMLELRKDNKSNAITTVSKDSIVVDNSKDLTWRKLTCVEAERLQTVPDNYTSCVSKTQRFKMLGNGWSVDVIAHILTNMEL